MYMEGVGQAEVGDDTVRLGILCRELKAVVIKSRLCEIN